MQVKRKLNDNVNFLLLLSLSLLYLMLNTVKRRDKYQKDSLIMFSLQVQNLFKHCEIEKKFIYQKRYLRDGRDIPNDNQCPS